MSQRPRRYQRFQRYPPPQRRRGRGCLTCLTVLVWAVVLGYLGLRFVVQPRMTQYLERQIATQLDPQVAADLSADDALRQGLDQLPDVPIPAGQLTVTEDQANALAGSYAGQVDALDGVQVRFVPGEVQVDLTAQGFTNTARIVPEVRDGRIVAASQSLDPPLGLLISLDDLTSAVIDQLNADAAAQGRRVTAVEIQQGVAIVVVE